jgi:aubergine-like protein
MTELLNPEQNSLEGKKNISLSLFPKRQFFQKSGNEVSLASNFFRFKFTNDKFSHFQKYAVNFEPDIPGDAHLLRRRLFRQAEEKIKLKLGQCLFNTTTLYSKELYSEPFEETVENQGQSYVIKILWANEVGRKTHEALATYKRFFQSSIKQMKFIELKRSFFDPKCATNIEDHGITIWSGFKPIINIYQQDILLNLNTVSKIFRRDTALELLMRLRNAKDHGDLKENISQAFKGLVVLTKYNNDKTYTVDSVNLDLTPMSTFNTKDGAQSYMDYYKAKYGITIKDKGQPLLVVNLKKGTDIQVIHLIPELCFLSGLTEEQRANFNLMKQINEIAIGNPKSKVEESKKLLSKILGHEACKKEIERWGMTIDFKPVELKGRKLNAGNLLLKKNDGGRLNVDIENTPDLDRKIQSPMYSQPAVNEWAVNIYFLTIYRLFLMERILKQLKSLSKHLGK